MRLEDELILACTCQEFSEAKKENIWRLLTGSPDWQYIHQASINHAVLPIVARNLLDIAKDLLPGDVLHTYRDFYQTNIARSLYVTNILLDIILRFKVSGIESVPFKGPVLAQDLYGDVGIRTFSDLDILVGVNDGLDAIQILMGMGYTPFPELSTSQMVSYMKYEDDLLLVNEKTGTAVEVHWEMSGRYLSRPMDMGFVQKGLSTLKIMDRDVNNLACEDQLVYLCVHGARHMWERLEWIFSVSELVRVKPELQWDVIFKKSEELRCRRMVIHSLSLAAEIFQIVLPENIIKLVAEDNKLTGLTDKIRDRLFPLYDEDGPDRIGLRLNPYQFKLRDSLLEAVTYGVREFTEPKEADWHWLPLPGKLSFLYIFLRPLRQVLKLIGNIITKISGRAPRNTMSAHEEQ